MSMLDVKSAILRFRENENRTDVFVNAPQNEEYYTTNTTPPQKVESLPHFMGRVTDQVATVIAEIEEVSGWAQSVQPLAGSAVHLRRSWVLQADVPVGGTVTLPVGYFPNRNMILLWYNNFACMPSTAPTSGMSNTYYQYTEASDKEAMQFTITINFAAKKGDLFDIWVISSITQQMFNDITAIHNQVAYDADRALGAAVRAEMAQAISEVARDEARTFVFQAQVSATNATTAAQSAADEAAHLAYEQAQRDIAQAIDEALAESNQMIIDAVESVVDEITDGVTASQTAQAAAEAARDESIRLAAEAATSERNAALSETNAAQSATQAAGSATAAQTSATAASGSANLSAQNATAAGNARVAAEKAAQSVTSAVSPTITIMNGPFTAGVEVNVPSYTVGSNRLEVYIAGFYAQGGTAANPNRQYTEIGSAGTISTKIAFNDDYTAQTNLITIVSRG